MDLNNNSFSNIDLHKSYKYSSDSNHIPLEFYEKTFPISKSIDLLIGYFSYNAIKFLSKSFAEFIMNGGNMRIITNRLLSTTDYAKTCYITNPLNENEIIDFLLN